MQHRRLAIGGVALAAALTAYLLIAPRPLPARELAPGYTPDLVNGAVLFNAGNCSACHMTPDQEDRFQLGGGRRLESPFGAFLAPNISPDRKTGIGDWSELSFVSAMKRGVGRKGEHLYPAFPYAAYSRMTTKDVRDLFAYLKTLPPVSRANQDHSLYAPFNVRMTVGVWKLLYFRPRTIESDPTRSSAWNRGRYLAEGPAHCAECHTPRDALGGPDDDRLYAGAPSLEAGGRFATNITPHPDGIGDWTVGDIADFLKTGTDKCFNEPVGMREVLESTSRYTDEDLAALSTYIHALPSRAGNRDKKAC
ncbi:MULTISPECIES: cytochrome c [unclassified Phenylobacterium]|uniref:cytochrome c n=1 Tax=unclassified Phenylobacterium TaxID=2640670 RepID=UPI00083B8527|nr:MULTISPECIES: cytochrome c [unclassified Phenylobacterium]